MARQHIQFEQGGSITGDTGERGDSTSVPDGGAESIKPLRSGERVGKDVLNRPAENIRKRTERLREVGEEALFRCLHVCFLPRSSCDIHKKRMNIRFDSMEDRDRSFLYKGVELIKRFFGQTSQPRKIRNYMRGELVQKDIKAFLKNDKN